MPEADAIDPRHDPIYQRGYDPTVHGAPSEAETAATRRSRARRDVDLDLFAPPSSRGRRGVEGEDASGETGRTDRTRPASRSVAPPVPGDDEAVVPTSRAADASTMDPGTRDPDLLVDPPSVPAGIEPAAAPVAPWRNPYLLGLVIGGAVLALAGFQMFRSALETIYVDFARSGFIFGGGESTDEASDPTAELVSMQLGWSIGPLLFVIGLVSILSAVIFVAVRWRPGSAAASGRKHESEQASSTADPL